MTPAGDAHGSMRPRRDASSRLARLLDRAVVFARLGRLLELVGRVLVAVAVAVLAIAIACSLGLRLPFPAGPIAVAAAIAIAARQGTRTWTWPDRLATAMALEKAHPRIGERISRAVGFIGMPSKTAGPPTDLPMVDLVAEAVEEAATAVESLAVDRSGKRHAIRGPLLPLRWPAAGLAAGVAIAVAVLAVPERLVPQLAEAFFLPRPARPIVGPVETEPPTALPKAATAAAVRLAEAAATEERLAVVLLARFARLPGGSREELTRREQDWLDETAAVQAAIADDIGRDLGTVVAAVARTDPRIADELAGGGLVRERVAALEQAAERIRGNQLAAASGLIASQVRPILSALGTYGVVPSGKTGPAFDRAELVRRRILAAIEADGDRVAAVAAEAGTIPKGNALDLAPADGAGRGPTPSTLGTAAIETAAIDRTASQAAGTKGTGGGPAGDAGSTAGTAGSTGGTAGEPASVAATDPGGRLPAWVRAREERPVETLAGDDFAAPPRYRAAVDDYYRRLWAVESPAGPAPLERRQREQEAAP